jgi:hypothetical protein
MLEAETMDGNNILLYSITGYIVQYMSGTTELVKHNDSVRNIKPGG